MVERIRFALERFGSPRHRSQVAQLWSLGIARTMPTSTPETQKLPDYWEHPDADMAALLHAELQRELPQGHLLFGVSVETFGWTGRGSDDILFRWLDSPDRFTVIHLSWLGRTEINAQHPWVEHDGSFADFLAYHEQFLKFCRDNAKRREA